MPSPFLRRLCALIAGTQPLPPAELPFVRPAFEDTLAVALAGWGEPVARKVARVYGAEAMTLDDFGGVAPETAALLIGTAGHALDYDDVHQASHTHPSIPVIAALVAAAREEPELGARMATAFAIAIATNVAIGNVLGFSHYQKGWHATSAIGPMATAAALAFLYGMDAETAAQALALAAAQCGGLQRNFGQMAKPLQAGLAGAAGLRAARLARAGVTADGDVFGPKGYFDLYRGENLVADPDTVEPDLHAGGISVKLYPCCFGNHRHIANALALRAKLEKAGVPLSSVHGVQADAPFGAYTPLRVLDPRQGLEGKFCLSYNIATALLDGGVTLAHFEDPAVARPEVRGLMAKVSWSERPAGEDPPDGLETAPVTLEARGPQGERLALVERSAHPGSPQDPVTPAQLEAKVRDCLDFHARCAGRPYAYDRFQQNLDAWLAVPGGAHGRPVQMALGGA